MIAIIDYGMGNLRSVQKAFEYVGFETKITDNYKDILKADKVILPGVGAFSDAIKTIREKEFDKALEECINNGKKILGICLGMQLLFDVSYENGEYEGLKILKGEIIKFKSGLKVPHVGWNSLDIIKNEPLFEGLEKNPFVYFVHSYYLKTDEPIVSATTNYGENIQIAIQKNNVYALQFHPEKSGNTGLKILKNFGGL